MGNSRMILNKWMFWGIIIFTSAGTAAIDLIFPPEAGIGTQVAIVFWLFFTMVGLVMMTFAWTQDLRK